MTLTDNRIAELCAEPVPYGLLINIDHLLEVQITGIAREAVEAGLWQLLLSLQSSDAISANGYRNKIV